MRIFLLAVLSFSLSGLFAQPQRCSFQTPQQADNWLFFQNVGLKFTDAGVQTNHNSSSNLSVGKGTAAISDENGKLLLYTDGMKVWNGAHVQINAGSNLPGNLGATQSSLIVPKPGSKKDYYIFTTDVIDYSSNGSYATNGFNYSRVDLSLNNNQGAVSSERDIQLLSESAEMISGVKHANGIDYWVVTHSLKGNSFHAFLVDSSGINQTAVVSSVGSEFEHDNNLFYKKRDYLGAMKLSPKGDKIAFASFGKNVVEVFSFNDGTGLITNHVPISIDLQGSDWGPYYVEFSPDGTKLYYTIVNLDTGLSNELYQYDIIDGGQPVLLNNTVLDFYSDVTAIQLARDGKIYVGRYLKNMLGIIENPNRPGLSCNYNQNGLNLGTKKALFGMPNFIQSYFDIPTFNYYNQCIGDSTRFTLLNKSNIDSMVWDFDDPDSPEPGTGPNPRHKFSESGLYNVTYTELHDGESYSTTIPVIIHSLPPEPLVAKGDSMYLFPGSKVPLDAGEGMFAYLWQDGSSNQIFEVSEADQIEVTVEDMNCCFNSGSLKVILLDIALPNAFTPNGDELNQEFFAFGPSNGIENFNLKIYNHWGQLVWEANEFDQKWDGTIKGQLASRGLYTWLLGFDVIGDLEGIGRVKHKGTVTLLR